jgi:hypothetical protein
MSSAAMLACVRLAAAKVEDLHNKLLTELKAADDRAKQVPIYIISHHMYSTHAAMASSMYCYCGCTAARWQLHQCSRYLLKRHSTVAVYCIAHVSVCVVTAACVRALLMVTHDVMNSNSLCVLMNVFTVNRREQYGCVVE